MNDADRLRILEAIAASLGYATPADYLAAADRLIREMEEERESDRFRWAGFATLR